MGQRAVPARPVEAAAIARLLEVMAERDVSRRGLAEIAGIPRTRVATIFKGEVSCSVSDFVDFCSALGLRASSVIRGAEEVVAADPPASTAAPVVPLPTPPPPPLHLAAARQVDERPEWHAMHQWDDAGEETQDEPDWDKKD